MADVILLYRLVDGRVTQVYISRLSSAKPVWPNITRHNFTRIFCLSWQYLNRTEIKQYLLAYTARIYSEMILFDFLSIFIYYHQNKSIICNWYYNINIFCVFIREKRFEKYKSVVYTNLELFDKKFLLFHYFFFFMIHINCNNCILQDTFFLLYFP